MAGGQVAQSKRGEDAAGLPRHGSLYDRLELAREQRLKSLAPPSAANDAPRPATGKPRTLSKGHLLPAIKDQEVFDPPSKEGMSPALRLTIGAIAFAIMAGLTLMDWRSKEPLTEVSAPTAQGLSVPETNLPQADAPARITDAPKIAGGATDGLPAVPEAPSESPPVEVQLETAPLTPPDTNSSATAAD